MKPSLRLLALNAMLAIACLAAPSLSVRAAEAVDRGEAFHALTAPDAALETVGASDARFRLEGRFDLTAPAAPVVIWQASRISIDFDGRRLALLFKDLSGQCFFNAEVDGVTHVVALRDPATRCYELAEPLAAGHHRLTLFKRSEAAAGYVAFGGIQVERGAAVRAPAAPAYAARILFVGDSITVGACNEDGPEDQWADRLTHNNALAYGALTAAAFRADYRCIAVSGMGIVIGWVEPKAGEIWNRVYPRPDSPKADLRAWQPDVVFVNFGENDNSFTGRHNMPFPSDFADKYVALIEAMRAAYPKAQIVLLRGGMAGGATSEPLRKAWEQAVARLEANDPAVAHFAFKHWTGTHPRVADDRAMAAELTDWLRGQGFMARAEKAAPAR